MLITDPVKKKEMLGVVKDALHFNLRRLALLELEYDEALNIYVISIDDDVALLPAEDVKGFLLQGRLVDPWVDVSLLLRIPLYTDSRIYISQAEKKMVSLSTKTINELPVGQNIYNKTHKYVAQQSDIVLADKDIMVLKGLTHLATNRNLTDKDVDWFSYRPEDMSTISKVIRMVFTEEHLQQIVDNLQGAAFDASDVILSILVSALNE